MSQQAIGFHQREINRRMAERGMPTAAWSAERVAYEMRRSRDEYRAHMIHENEENARLEALLAKVNESPYSPAFLKAIADTCSTPATRAGKTQDEVFKEEGT